MPPWLRYLVAFVVFCHGFVYLRIGAVLPGPVKGWKGRSWLLRGAIGGDPLIALVRVLHVFAGVAIVACAIAIAFVPAWWRPLALAGAGVGVIAFATFWDGQAKLLFDEGGLGAAISLFMFGAALYLGH